MLSIRITAFLAILPVAGLLADTIVLRDGRTIEGTFLGGDSRQIRIANGDRVDTFRLDEVDSVKLGTAATEPRSSTVAPRSSAVAPPAGERAQREQREAVPPHLEPARGESAARLPGERVIPTGTAFVIRMIDGIDSGRDRVGQTFKASIEEPVMSGADTVIPRGADVVVKLVDDQQSGRITGRTELTVDIVSVQVNGRMVDIDTQTVTQSSASRTSRSGKVIGGAALLGTIVGAIAGGGKGAVIGLASGAGAGTAVQAATKGQRVRIPPETRLTFSLQQPVRL